MEHLIHNVLDQTKVDVISAARIPEAKADDMNIMMVDALSNCILGGLLRVAYNLREKEERNHLFISGVLTKREREKEHQLRKQLRKKTGEG